jgi:hypothetical protein
MQAKRRSNPDTAVSDDKQQSASNPPSIAAPPSTEAARQAAWKQSWLQQADRRGAEWHQMWKQSLGARRAAQPGGGKPKKS